ncbi:hypothetical protein QE152_g5680 [Popillia japonica]|uniref:ATP-binding protein n=1 Tax=Popillia japonica TaxID=7064 RepID=A0AAW1MLL8_POPJA
MFLNPKKSTSITFAATGDICVPRTKPYLRVDGVLIPVTDSLHTFRFLGHFFGPSGAAKSTVFHLSRWLQCVNAAPLKPNQKLTMLRDHVVPRLLYGFQNPRLTARQNSCFYARARDGGLGFPDLRRSVPRIMLELINRLDASTDPMPAALFACPFFDHLRGRLVSLAGDTPPAHYWREAIADHTSTRGLEAASEDSASRLWAPFSESPGLLLHITSSRASTSAFCEPASQLFRDSPAP